MSSPVLVMGRVYSEANRLGRAVVTRRMQGFATIPRGRMTRRLGSSAGIKSLFDQERSTGVKLTERRGRSRGRIAARFAGTIPVC